MTERMRPRNRRASTTISVAYQAMDGFTFKGYVTYSRDMEGKINEVFIVAGKPGSPNEAAYRDAGLVVSLALQHGIPLATLATAVTRADNGLPGGPLGVVFDRLIEEEKQT